MESELLTRDYQKPPSLKERVSGFIKYIASKSGGFSKLKNPKVLTIIVLALLLLLVFLAIMAITAQKKSATQAIPQAAHFIQQSNSAKPTPAPTGINLQIQKFNQDLNNTQPYFVQLKQPIVDLDLNFEK